MDRRSFIRTGIGTVGGLLLPWERHLASTSSVSSKAKVWIAEGLPQEAVRQLVKAVGGLEAIIPVNGVVLLKPNIAFPAPPEWGVTTDPEFLDAIIGTCFDAGARRVIVTDHPVGASPEKNLVRSGIGAVCDKWDNAKLLIPDGAQYYRPYEVPQGKALKTTQVLKSLDKVDLFINLPTAKHHSATGVSLGLKNLMGLIQDRVPFHSEFDLHQGIADLASVIRPGITFLDARYCLLSGGPTGPGQVEQAGKYLAGFDPVAVDAIGVEQARWEGRIQKGSGIPHLVKANELGLGEVRRDLIDVIELQT